MAKKKRNLKDEKTVSEKIVKIILKKRHDLTVEEILEKIEEKKKSSAGYLSTDVAARIVASELDVETPSRHLKLRQVTIKSLVSGVDNATVTGRISQIFQPKGFKRKNGSEGKVAHLVLADKTGCMRVVLWDDKADLVNSRDIRIGQLVSVLHGYVREGRDGNLEMHLGFRGDLQVVIPNNFDGKIKFSEKSADEK